MEDLQLITAAPLPYLLSLPGLAAPGSRAWPVLCFLHGYGEGTPMPIREALTLHGPLRHSSSPRSRAGFLVVAPQLPGRGDLWYLYADAVQQIVLQVRSRHHGDPARTYLTGFSFGGNGVFDLALRQRDFWAALWPVDPTRVPAVDPGRPLWLSSGEISRNQGRAFIQRLGLRPPGEKPGDRIYVDQGQDHVGTATLAYRDDRIYGWLLAQHLPEG